MTTKREVSERTEEEEALADLLTAQYGGFWALVSAYNDGDGLGISVALGPGLGDDVELSRQLLRKTLEAL